MQKKFKIKKNDNVEVLAGKDKGKRGSVVRIIPKKDKVKRRSQQDQGGIVEVEAPLHISNVGIVCKKCGRPVKIGYKIDGDKKVRVCRKCGETL